MLLVVKDLEENLMPRKFTPEQRKRMLDRLESGATYAELKREFGIRDSRTLERQLKQAREEQALSAARTDIVKESLRDHLNEVKGLIETWSLGLRAPSPPSLGRYPLSSSEEAEHTRLFQGVRQHLPFKELWKNYETFKAEWDKYLGVCEALHHEVVTKAVEKWGLTLIEKDERRAGLTTFFSWETLDHSIKVAEGDHRAGMPRYDAALLQPGVPELEYLMCDNRVILYGKQAMRYADDHQAMIAEWARSKIVLDLVNTLGELRDLERRMHDLIEEALLRRDHILYQCALCPGGSKLALK
jgi:hypothetical protein